MTNQGTEEVDSFQDELLMSYSGDAQLLQLLVGDVQQLLAPHLLPLETLHVLLETVIQTWAEDRRRLARADVCVSTTTVERRPAGQP